MHLASHIEYRETNPSPSNSEIVDVGRTPVSPLVMIGVRCLALGPVTLTVDATYGWYPNSFTYRGQSFDFGMKGVAIRPTLLIRL
jgi:hypothetical protein